MNEIKIITELCTEDRARLDRLAEALEKLQPIEMGVPLIDGDLLVKAQAHLNEVHGDQEPVVVNVSVDLPTVPQDVTEAKAEEITPQAEEITPQAEEAPTEEKEVPEHTQAELQQKVISLVSGGKKDDVKKIIEQYAPRVSAIPPEKINEVWDKLTELEGK